MISIFGFLIVLSVIVFVHEFGHYYTAIKCGVMVEEFSIGFGKTIFSRIDKKGTYWKIRMIPIGGFVKMYGDKNPSSETNDNFLSGINEKEKAKSFVGQSVFKRLLIVAAGPLANYILSIFIFTYLYFSIGLTSVQPFVGKVLENSPAYQAGIKEGDKILKVNNSNIKDFIDIRKIITSNRNENITILIERQQKQITLSIPSIQNHENKLIGIGADETKIEKININIFESFFYALSRTYNTTSEILSSIKKMIFDKKSTAEIGGVISIARESGKSLENGSILSLIAFISINIGLMNLFPIPALDGGHIMFLTYEGIMKKRLSTKIEALYYKIGYIIIIFLIVISTLNDIKSLLL